MMCYVIGEMYAYCIPESEETISDYRVLHGSR